jgi:hypothetical protein
MPTWCPNVCGGPSKTAASGWIQGLASLSDIEKELILHQNPESLLGI